MSLRKVRFAELSDPVRAFLNEIRSGEGVIVEDERGRPRYGISPYDEATEAERQAAWLRLQELQREVRRRIEAEGKTEEELEQILREEE